MQDIYLIHTKLDLKQAMCLYVDCHILEIYKAVHRDTSSNHAEIIAIHEASRECVWLRSMIHLIREKCGLKCDKLPTTLYEDNAACIAQLKGGFIKGDRTKHISPKIFYTHELQKNGDINVQQIRSSDNVADLFTKSLPTATFKKMVHKLGMRKFKSLD